MAGRGRGRGQGGYGGGLSFRLDMLGVSRADLMNMEVEKPRSLYDKELAPTMPQPNTEYVADDLKQVEIALRMKDRWRKRAAHMVVEEKKKDISRYSDKYQLNPQKGPDFTPDWSQFPEELHADEGRRKKQKVMAVEPNLKAASTTVDTKSILAKAKEYFSSMNVEGETSEAEAEETTVEQDDDDDSDKSSKDSDEEEEDQEELALEHEEEEEDENDYNMSYFDNGEAYLDDDNDDDDGAMYN